MVQDEDLNQAADAANALTAEARHRIARIDKIRTRLNELLPLKSTYTPEQLGEIRNLLNEGKTLQAGTAEWNQQAEDLWTNLTLPGDLEPGVGKSVTEKQALVVSSNNLSVYSVDAKDETIIKAIDERHAEAEANAQEIDRIARRVQELTVKIKNGTATEEEMQEGRRLAKIGVDLQQRNANLGEEIPMLRSKLTVTEADQAGAGKVEALADKRLARDIDGTRQLCLADRVKQQGLGTLTSVLTGIAEKSYPWVLKKFYPRHYENIGQYHSPKEVAVWLTTAVAESLRYGFLNSPTAYRLMMPAFKPLIDKQMPMFFIAPELLQAVMMTDFDDDIDWTQMKLPYEHGVFILPRGGFRHPTDGDVHMILWSRNQGGASYPPPVPGIPTIEIQNTAFVTTALCPEKGIWYDACLNAAHRPTLKLRNLFYRGPEDPAPTLTKGSAQDEDLAEEDAPFCDSLGVIVFGTLLAMNARPELVERSQLLKRVPAKGDKPVREFWSPNVIGRKYKAKREIPKVRAGKFVFPAKESGHHASPRLHWRRGHFRNQAYGPERRLRKVIWLEPCLIGGV